jgi:hypothetical protein
MKELIEFPAASTSRDDREQSSQGTATAPPSELELRQTRKYLKLSLLLAMSAAIMTGAATIEYIPGGRRFGFSAESGTEDLEVDEQLKSQFRELFRRGAFEVFHDGMRSQFERGLILMLKQNGRTAYRAIADLTFSEHLNPDVLSEALRLLGDLNDPGTASQRLAIWERALHDDSPKVRDGAILGLASVDLLAEPIFQKALETETIAELRATILDIIQGFNSTNVSSSSSSTTESLA